MVVGNWELKVLVKCVSKMMWVVKVLLVESVLLLGLL